MSRQGANRSSRRASSSMVVGSNEAISSVNVSANKRLDQMLDSSSESVEEHFISPMRVGATSLSQTITHTDAPPVSKHAMNLRRCKIEQQDDHSPPDLQRSSDRHMHLRNESKPSGLKNLASSPSPSERTTQVRVFS